MQAPIADLLAYPNGAICQQINIKNKRQSSIGRKRGIEQNNQFWCFPTVKLLIQKTAGFPRSPRRPSQATIWQGSIVIRSAFCIWPQPRYQNHFDAEVAFIAHPDHFCEFRSVIYSSPADSFRSLLCPAGPFDSYLFATDPVSLFI